jgi:O-antigen/teichoic acid export membrane protein
MMLNLGISTAVGRYVARTTELNDSAERDRIVSTSLAMLGALAGVGALLCGGATLSLHQLFPKVPPDLLGDARKAVLLIGLSNALVMVTSAFAGVFFGIQRNIVPALCVFGTRILLVPAVMVAVQTGGGVVLVASIYASANCLLALLQYLAFRKLGIIRLARSAVDSRVAREVGHYCAGLSVWTLAMLLVNGLDAILVARFNFDRVGAYTMASGLIACIVGLQQAILQTLIPEGAKLNVAGGSEMMGKLLLHSTRVSTILLSLSTLPLIVLAGPLVRLWVGETYGAEAAPILAILAIASLIRLILNPYAVLLIAVAQQKMALASAMIEGVTNLVFSLILGRSMGAIGVAEGTLIGAIVGVAGHMLYNMPRTDAIRVNRLTLIYRGMLLPLIAFAPSSAILLLLWQHSESMFYRFNLCLVSSCLCLVLVDRVVLKPEERSRIYRIVDRLRGGRTEAGQA